jgi:hypothetical protein
METWTETTTRETTTDTTMDPIDVPMDLFDDQFMRGFVTQAEQIAAEPDQDTRDPLMAALAANILVRLVMSNCVENDTQQQAAMLAARLFVSLPPRVRSSVTIL